MTHTQNSHYYENKAQVEKYCNFPLKYSIEINPVWMGLNYDKLNEHDMWTALYPYSQEMWLLTDSFKWMYKCILSDISDFSQYF